MKYLNNCTTADITSQALKPKYGTTEIPGLLRVSRFHGNASDRKNIHFFLFCEKPAHQNFLQTIFSHFKHLLACARETMSFSASAIKYRYSANQSARYITFVF